MATTTLEQEISELEQEYWRAIRDKDTDAALRLTSDPCLVSGAQGAQSIDHNTFREMAKSPMWELKKFEMSDTSVITPTDDVAVIGYTITEHLEVDGKPMTLEAAESSTWVRQNGRWQCVQHSESVLGDPFGRR
jgi:ketosteroid isomerase-like protein